MWGTHLTEWIHAICAHSKPNISQFFSKPTKYGIINSPLSGIHRVLYHCVILITLFIPTHQLGLLSIGKHTLQMDNYRKIPHHLPRSPFTFLASIPVTTIISTLISMGSIKEALIQLYILSMKQDTILLTCMYFFISSPKRQIIFFAL